VSDLNKIVEYTLVFNLVTHVDLIVETITKGSFSYNAFKV